MAKIETLFGKMEISYALNTGKIMNFCRGQDLANGMMHYIKHQRPEIPNKCMEILFSTSNIYPSLVVGAVDGLDMTELFSSKPALPSSTTTGTIAATVAGNHLATIATSMSTIGTGLTSKAAATYADADREETMDFKDMPPDVRARYTLKKNKDVYIRQCDLTLFQNDLTKDKHGTSQQWRTVQYPSIVTAANTTKHEGQTYLVMSDGSTWGHLDYQSNKHKTAFLASAPDMSEYTPRGFYNMCMTMELNNSVISNPSTAPTTKEG